MPAFQDITGQYFGKLVAVGVYARAANRGHTKWLCKCDCGKHSIVDLNCLRRGHTKSCGCLKKKGNPTHGSRYTPTYRSWDGMVQRCTNVKNPAYKDYGGRGIKVYERWLVFENFLTDMGECPEGYSIERIDNNGCYEPKNCMWIPRNEQQKNQRRSRSNSQQPSSY